MRQLLRTKGELLLHQAGDQSISAAERCFSEAIEVAREQDTLSWELRIALSFARLRVGQDRQDDARLPLSPVYNRFTEGFETRICVPRARCFNRCNVITLDSRAEATRRSEIPIEAFSVFY
jgi:predicted ATPase